MSTAIEVLHESNGLASADRQRAAMPANITDVIEAAEGLKLFRTFVKSELKEGHDFGVIPGTGDKNALLQPGAQKIAMFFNCYPKHKVTPNNLEHGHVEFIVETRLISRVTNKAVGSGFGSCSTLEGKYRFRNANRRCPQCGKETIFKSKNGEGFYCWRKKDGCGATFHENHKDIVGQQAGKVENENIADQRNTVLKMAVKRAFVAASMCLGCASEMFTQDIDDIYDLEAEEAEAFVPAPPPPPVNNNTGHGHGKYVNAEKEREYDDARKAFVEKTNTEWVDRWQLKNNGHPMEGIKAELISSFQVNGHIVKWAVETGLLDANLIPSDCSIEQRRRFAAVVFSQHRREMGKEMLRYAKEQAANAELAFYRKNPELAEDHAYEFPEAAPAPEDESQEPPRSREPGEDG